MLEIRCSNKIKLPKIDPVKREAIKKKLTLKNPAFWKLKAMGKWVGNTPEEFTYYEQEGECLIVPRGLLGRLERYLEVKIDRSNLVNIPSKAKFSPILLRDYQNVIMSSWEAKKPSEGIFCLSTGSGKTILALDLIQKLGLTATILVPNNVLLTQFVEEAKTHLNYEVGIINGKEKTIKDITVVCVASLFNNNPLLDELVAKTSVLVVDECAGFVSAERVKIIEAFKPSYLYGLTATPEREDGQSDAIFFYFGDIIEEYEAFQISPVVEVVDTETFIPIKIQYNEMVDLMINNDSRNTLIAWHIYRETMAGRKVLVLTKRVEHYKLLREKLPDNEKFVSADSSDSEIHEKLNRLRENKEDFCAILGTFALLGTGFNIEKLDTLIIAGDLRSQILTHQSSGRVLRLLKDKTAKIIDFYDSQNGIFKNQFNQRRKFYEKKKWVVKTKWDK
jgi:superfamily II DNA or RNA helicase